MVPKLPGRLFQAHSTLRQSPLTVKFSRVRRMIVKCTREKRKRIPLCFLLLGLLVCLQHGFRVRFPRGLELFTLAAERTGPVEVVDVDTFLSNEAVKRNRRVYFTQISSNEYAIGATMLACRLSRLNSTIPIVVLVDRPVSVDALAFLKSIPNTHLVRVTNPGRLASTKSETRVGT